MVTKKFTGELAEPLKPMFRGGLLSTGPFSHDDVRERAALQVRKMQLLAAHYGVENQDVNLQTLCVALELAKEFVPGFQVADPNKHDGRPQVWTELREGFLIIEMEKEQRKGDGCSVSDAASKLSKRTPWKQICALARPQDAAGTLRKRYYSARRTNRWQNVLRDSNEYQKLLDQADDGIYADILNSLHLEAQKIMYR